MKRIKWLFALAIAVLIISCKKESSMSQRQDSLQKAAISGSGAPSGPQYNLNIIGVGNPKTFDYNTFDQQNPQGQGLRIFVPLDGNAKILLKDGEYDVLDANGTDGIAAFQLPATNPNNDGITNYSVYIRGLVATGSNAKMSSCLTDGTDTYCSIGQNVYVKPAAHGNENRFTNVSRELLYVYADTDGNGSVERISLFAGPLYTYYWEFIDTELKLAQLRFYDISTNSTTN